MAAQPPIRTPRLSLVVAALAAAFSLVVVRPAPLAAQRGLTLRGGINLSRFVGGNADTDSKRGLNLGGALRVAGVGPVAIWMEGYYRQKGARGLAYTDPQNPPANLEVGIDYVEVPVLLRLDLPALGSRVRPYLQGGPAFGWKIDCSVSISAQSGGQPTPDCDALLGGNAEETLRDYEQGLVIGGGLDLDVLGGFGSLNLDARLTRGLSRLSDGSDGVKNQSFTLMLGYALGTGGLMPGG